MKKTILKEVPVRGLPLYEMQELFSIKGSFEAVKLSVISLLPGQRVPEKGWGSHEEDEYSFFTEGQVYTESGDFKGLCGQGEATLIPRGEKHWCENRSDKVCRLVCMLVK